MDNITFTLGSDDLDHLRLALREQLAADHDLLREVRDGLAPGWDHETVAARIARTDHVAGQLGGLY